MPTTRHIWLVAAASTVAIALICHARHRAAASSSSQTTASIAGAAEAESAVLSRAAPASSQVPASALSRGAPASSQVPASALDSSRAAPASSQATASAPEGQAAEDTQVESHLGAHDGNQKESIVAAQDDTFTVACWNILAQGYVRPSSYPYCPRPQLQWEHRQPMIIKHLKACTPQLICLQEVEVHCLPGLLAPLEELGFDHEFMKRGGHKQDGCLLLWQRSVFARVEGSCVALGADVAVCADMDVIARGHLNEARFLRHNVGMVLPLQHLPTARRLVAQGHCPCRAGVILVATTHLYWNPLHEDVKFRQMAFFLKRTEAFRSRLEDAECTCGAKAAAHRVGVVVCGDFNSSADTSVYKLASEGSFAMEDTDDPSSFSKLRVLVDVDMFKVAKWLRAVGVDAAHWKVEGGAKEAMFDMAVREKRILITHSNKLVQRRNCPPYLLVSAHGKRALEDIIEHFQLDFDEARVYSRCTLCNGTLQQMTLEEAQAGGDVPDGLSDGQDETGATLSFVRCLLCSQLYWWGGRTAQNAEEFKVIFERVKARMAGEEVADLAWESRKQRRKLKKEQQIKERSLVPAGVTSIGKGDLKSRFNLLSEILGKGKSFVIKRAERKDDGAHVAVKMINKKKLASSDRAQMVQEALAAGHEVLESPDRVYVLWPLEHKEESEEEEEEEEDEASEQERELDPEEVASLAMTGNVTHSLQLSSAYAQYRREGEPAFTNFTGTFRGCLDYIFHDSTLVRHQVAKLLSMEEIRKHTALPNEHWPSDHLLLAATFSFSA